MKEIALNRKKRSIAVVVACPFPANHGTPAGIREVSHEISRLGNDNHVVTYPIGDNSPVDGMKIHRINVPVRNTDITVGPSFRKILWDIVLAYTLCRVIKKEDIDIIHAHNYEGALVGYIAKLVTGRPLIYNAVNTMIDELPTYNFIKPRFIAHAIAHFFDYLTPRTANHIIAISEELISFFQKKGIKNELMTYIPLGINAAHFRTNGSSSVREIYDLGQRPVVMYTGTLDEFQRIDYLLKAFGIVFRKKPDAVLMLVNNIVNSGQKDKYTKMSGELEISSNTIFVDEVSFDELPSYLEAADIAALSRPHCPGFPVKLLNYMAAKKPIVTFAGSAKGLTHMGNAYIVPDGDVQGLSDGIVKLIDDKKTARCLAEKGYDFLMQNYDLKVVAEKINDVYCRMSGYN